MLSMIIAFNVGMLFDNGADPFLYLLLLKCTLALDNMKRLNHQQDRYRLPMKIQRNNKLIAYGWIERERLRVLVVTKNPRRRTTRKTEIISSVFGRWLLTQKSPEPVHVRLRLRKHDVKRRGASPQRLLDILRADDERTREFGTAAWKRVLPIKLYSVDYCTSPLNSMPIWFRCV